jgi:hypothetical protein
MKEEKFSAAIKNILMMLSIASLVVTLGAHCSQTRRIDQTNPQICVICDPPCTGNTRCNSSNGKCEAIAIEQNLERFVSSPNSDRIGTPTTNKDFYILQIAIPR